MAPATDLRPGGPGRRGGAALLDSLIGLGLWLLGALWLVILVWAPRQTPLDLGHALVLAGAILALGPVLHLAYHTAFVGALGQTPGQMVLGLAVVTADGRPAGYARAFVRALVGGLAGLLLLGLGHLPVLVTRRRRGLHDWAAGVMVVRA